MLYIAGLSPLLQIEVQLQHQPDLETAMTLARRFLLSVRRQRPKKVPSNHNTEIQISVHGLTGITTSPTMQLSISINGNNLLALLDSGSTHNFVDSDIVTQLNLQSSTAPSSHRVAVTNGDHISNVGRYDAITFAIDNEQFKADFYNIELGGYDIVLGVDWLSSLGTIVWNFNKLTMKFWRKGRPITWTSLTKGEALPSGIYTISSDSIVENLLQMFQDLFREPSSLPLQRCYDNRIHLKDPTQPTVVRPKI